VAGWLGLQGQSFPVGLWRQQALRPSEEEAACRRLRAGPAEATGLEEVSSVAPPAPHG